MDVTPDTLGSSKASITILWFEPRNLKTVSTDPISSASRLEGKMNIRIKLYGSCEKIIRTQGESRPIDYEWVANFLCKARLSKSFRLLSVETPRTYPRLGWVSSSKVHEYMVLLRGFFLLILLRYFCFLSRIFSEPISSFFFSGSSDFKSPLILIYLGWLVPWIGSSFL